MKIDLTGADVVDAHCHGFRSQDLLDRDPTAFETRCMFLGTECPVCPDSGDANDDGILNIADPIYLLNWRFSTGAPPAPPFPDCGLDPTGDGLDDCEGFTPCE